MFVVIAEVFLIGLDCGHGEARQGLVQEGRR